MVDYTSALPKTRCRIRLSKAEDGKVLRFFGTQILQMMTGYLRSNTANRFWDNIGNVTSLLKWLLFYYLLRVTQIAWTLSDRLVVTWIREPGMTAPGKLWRSFRSTWQPFPVDDHRKLSAQRCPPVLRRMLNTQWYMNCGVAHNHRSAIPLNYSPKFVGPSEATVKIWK